MPNTEHEFVSLGEARFVDAGKDGLAMHLETQHSPTHGRAYALGCLLDEHQGRTLLQALANAVESKWGKCFEPKK